MTTVSSSRGPATSAHDIFGVDAPFVRSAVMVSPSVLTDPSAYKGLLPHVMEQLRERLQGEVADDERLQNVRIEIVAQVVKTDD